MSLKNNSLALTLTYLLVMLLPNIFLTFFKDNNIYYALITICSLLGMLAMFYFNHKYPFINSLAPKKSSYLKTLLWGIGGAVAALILQHLSSFIEINFLNQAIESQNTAAALTILSQYPYYIFYIVLAAPIMEEFVFRKVLFGNLSGLLGQVGAALLSSTLFSIAHQDAHFFTYAIIGLTFCFIYSKTGKLHSSMLAHILMNTIIVILNLI
ncbi:CPBP family intramembrane glutamic endopeptidase [Liquorilactobacillus capillatus]|uniref:CAAX family protease n=1 Tax=Liquorilactobacillus capillatus DSM 19910 TaxID=1423731 RepID=A0A0R1MGN6_9LACO|nr:type II CAAX endopeptidase family protein [Liquorilactobacillus capillatus]KRL02888.1 CAAX family protease [Liquorilactobacillus capillatus DSM 19910]